MYAKFVYLGPTSKHCPRTTSTFGFPAAAPEPSAAILTTTTTTLRTFITLNTCVASSGVAISLCNCLSYNARNNRMCL